MLSERAGHAPAGSPHHPAGPRAASPARHGSSTAIEPPLTEPGHRARHRTPAAAAVLNLPVAERGTGWSAPPPPAETPKTPSPPSPQQPPPVPERAPGPGLRRGSAHRAPRDLPVRTRLAATRLLDQVLGDRRALPFLWDDDPRREVHQHEDAERSPAPGQRRSAGPRWGRYRRTRRARSRRRPRADLSVSGLASYSHWPHSCPRSFPLGLGPDSQTRHAYAGRGS